MAPQVDLTLASEFLAALGGSDRVFDFRTFPEKSRLTDDDGTPLQAHRHRGDFDTCASQLIARNIAGYGVSVAFNASDGEGVLVENFRRARAIAIDCDRGRPGSWCGPAPSIEVATPRGLHAYWLLAEGEGLDLDKWARVERAACRTFREETLDVAKVLRVPGFVHRKNSGAPFLVQLEACDPERRFGLDELVRELGLEKHYRTEPPRASRSIEDDRVPLERRLERCRLFMRNCPPAVSGSGGYARTKGICNVGWDFGLEPHEFWPLLLAWNDTCDPPWSEVELERKLERLHAGHHDDGFGWRLDIRGTAKASATSQPPRDAALPSDADDPRDYAAKRVVKRNAVRPDVHDDHDHDARSSAVDADDAAPPAREVPPPSEPPPPDDDGDGDDVAWGDRVLDRNDPLASARRLEQETMRWKTQRIVVHHRRMWWRWNSRCYKEVSAEDLNARIYRYCEPAVHEQVDEQGNAKLVPFKPDSARVNKIRHALESVAHLDDEHEAPCWLGRETGRPPPREIVACANGLLHIPTERFLGKRADYFTLSASTVRYNPKAATPATWLSFLDQLWPDDTESQQLLQEWCGLTLTPDTTFQKFLLVQGPKRSGKGTIARVLDALHGKGNVAWPTMTDLTSRFGLQTMLDKSVAIMPDVRISSRLDQGAALEVLLRITGEDTCQIDRKNLPAIQVQIPARFMLMTNVTPRLADAGAAFASRCLALKMESSFFGREDRHLTSRLLAEIEGIMLWSLEGLRRLIARGHFVQPATGLEVVDDLTELSTPVVTFVRERCDTSDPSKSETTDVLFEAWKKWCHDEGREAVGEKSTFVRNLISSHPGLRKGRPSDGGGGRHRTVVGLTLREGFYGRDDEPPAERSFWDRHPPRGRA